MKHVFIDTNVFLRIYSYSEDQPIFLKDVIGLINQKKIKLYITQQVVNEFYRNREVKLKPSLETIKELRKIGFHVPAFCANVGLIKRIRKKYDTIEKLARRVYIRLVRDYRNESLEVDKLVKKIFGGAGILPISEEVFSKARRRLDLGNPPGKKGSCGDAINWEILFESVPDGVGLYFITGDSDYLSDISDDNFSSFLRKEWKQKKKSEIVLYKSISRFLKEQFGQKKITGKQITEEERKVPFVVPGTVVRDRFDYPLFSRNSFVEGSSAFGSVGSSAPVSIFDYRGSVGFSGSVSPIPVSKKISCSICGGVFYTDEGLGAKTCPHCGYVNHVYG